MKKIILLIFVFGLFGCKKELLTSIDSRQSIAQSSVISNQKMENPYSLKNMNRAYLNLLQEKDERMVGMEKGIALNLSKDSMLLAATHSYIRILPKDSLHYEELLADTTMDFFDYPLDVDISEGEEVRVAPGNANGMRWLYTKVEKSSNNPLLKDAEFIEDLYIPTDLAENWDQNDLEIQHSPTLTINFDDILDESLRITGHDDDLVQGRRRSNRRWTPSATIKVYDETIKAYVPIELAKVRVRHFVRWRTGYTNADGYVRLPSFRKAVNYTVVWEQNKWDIRDGHINQAYYNGPKMRNHWHLEINGGKSVYYGTIHRACVNYFFKDIDGLKRPYAPGFLKKKISFYNKTNNSYNGLHRPWATWLSTDLFSQIQIYRRKDEGSSYFTWGLFGTSIHELAHSAHAVHVGRGNAILTSKMIAESWASAVAWYLVSKEYDRLNYSLKDKDLLNKQDWTPHVKNFSYSPIFIDLIDDYNQSDRNQKYPNDTVNGYTIGDLNNILMDVRNLRHLKKEVKSHKPSHVTDLQIDTLFLKYEEAVRGKL
ncbi:hypothetical protein [Sphingobacterium lactis]|uniref:hypothetical protein n=1 Tax=Sphingobacterium lactis TaxID=797291 RepID=UPI003DA54311